MALYATAAAAEDSAVGDAIVHVTSLSVAAAATATVDVALPHCTASPADAADAAATLGLAVVATNANTDDPALLLDPALLPMILFRAVAAPQPGIINRSELELLLEHERLPELELVLPLALR
jgi:hypothetical protein